jgi:hypothetical protein
MKVILPSIRYTGWRQLLYSCTIGLAWFTTITTLQSLVDGATVDWQAARSPCMTSIPTIPDYWQCHCALHFVCLSLPGINECSSHWHLPKHTGVFTPSHTNSLMHAQLSDWAALASTCHASLSLTQLSSSQPSLNADSHTSHACVLCVCKPPIMASSWRRGWSKQGVLGVGCIPQRVDSQRLNNALLCDDALVHHRTEHIPICDLLGLWLDDCLNCLGDLRRVKEPNDKEVCPQSMLHKCTACLLDTLAGM